MKYISAFFALSSVILICSARDPRSVDYSNQQTSYGGQGNGDNINSQYEQLFSRLFEQKLKERLNFLLQNLDVTIDKTFIDKFVNDEVNRFSKEYVPNAVVRTVDASRDNFINNQLTSIVNSRAQSEITNQQAYITSLSSARLQTYIDTELKSQIEKAANQAFHACGINQRITDAINKYLTENLAIVIQGHVSKVLEQDLQNIVNVEVTAVIKQLASSLALSSINQAISSTSTLNDAVKIYFDKNLASIIEKAANDAVKESLANLNAVCSNEVLKILQATLSSTVKTRVEEELQKILISSATKEVSLQVAALGDRLRPPQGTPSEVY